MMRQSDKWRTSLSFQFQPHIDQLLIAGQTRLKAHWVPAELDKADAFIQGDSPFVFRDYAQLQLRIACLAGTADAGGRER